MRDLTGDDVNVIFGAMYDESQPDTCKITVIATGLDVPVKNAAGNKPGSFGTYPGAGRFVPSPSYQSGMADGGVKRSHEDQAQGASPAGKPVLNGITKPTDIRSSVVEKSLKIPDFLQRGKN